MSHIFGRHTAMNLPVVISGEGCYLIDEAGRRYFDGSGGAAVSCLGHTHPAITSAIREQLETIEFAHTSFFTSRPAEELAELLARHAPGNIDRVLFVCGGSEAMEAAIKLARKYFLEMGEPERHRVIARRQSYHGSTLGVLAAGGNRLRREPYAPLLIEVSHISPCYEYRGLLDGENAVEYGRRVADELEAEIQRLGPETVMAFVAEPVVGATLGAVPPVEGYFRRIRSICDKYGVLLVLDEVMCGMGRTGTLFACEQDGVDPDIVAIAKGLGGGYQPIGAMLCTSGIYAAIEAGSGGFQHGHTYMGHPTACAAGLAVVGELAGQGLLQRVRELGNMLRRELESGLGQHPHVGDIRGRGMFLGIELVEDRSTKRPFAPDRRVSAAVGKAAFESGLICYAMGGTVDGVAGDHILLAPPFIMTDAQIDEVTGKLNQALKAAS